MLEMIIFAVVLVIAQTLSAYIMMNIMMKQFMSKKFIKKYSKMAVEATKVIQEEMEEIL